MSCAEYQEWISAQVDGELENEHIAQLHEHLKGCSRCRQVVEDYKVNRILLHAMEPRKAPADAFARLTARIEGGPKRPIPIEGKRPSPAPMQGIMRGLRAVACFAIVFIGALAWLGWTDQEVETVTLHRQVSVRPRVLMRGHAWLQASNNPVADGSAWHYLASEEENVQPANDDDEDLNQSSDAGRGM